MNCDAPGSLFATTIAVIRPARLDEAAALADLAERTFRDTYTAENTAGDMKAHIARSFSPELQKRELNDAAMSTIVAAMPDGALVGFAQLRSGPAPACVPQTGALEVWRFYVDREHHGQGVAQQLMTATIETAVQRDASALWLGVWERNWRARAFYAKCGFKDVGTQTFVLGADIQTDRVLVAEMA